MFSNPLLLSRRRCYHRIHLRLLPGCRCRSLCPGLLRRPRLLAGFLCRRLFASATTCACCRASASTASTASARCRAAAVVASINACCRAAVFAFASATTCACFQASASAASTRFRAAAAASTFARCRAAAAAFCLAAFLAIQLFVYPASSAKYKRSASLFWQ